MHARRLAALALSLAVVVVGQSPSSAEAAPVPGASPDAAPVDPTTDPAVDPAVDPGATPVDAAPAEERRRRFHPPHPYRAVGLRVGTFNIKNVVFDKHPTRDWPRRRAVIIRQVLSHRVGLLGIQEANPARYLQMRFPDGPNQYIDLKRGLNKAGGHYRLANAYGYNCRNSKTWRHCVHQDRGASGSTRILYDARRFLLVRSGSVKFRRQTDDESRYLAWAVLRSRSNGRSFLFASTHLTAGSTKVRKAQWRQVVRDVPRLAGHRPVVVTGDFNVQKYHPIARTMLPAMKAAGFGDVLNQQYRTNPSRNPRPRRLVDAWINSYNDGQTKVSRFGFAHQRHKIGNGIDWVFASNRLPVSSYKVVVDFDRRTLRIRGPLPSDHNLVTAGIQLPGHRRR